MADKGKSRSAAILVLLILAVGLGAVAVATVLGATWRISERRSGEAAGKLALDSMATKRDSTELLRINPEDLKAAMEKQVEISMAEPDLSEGIVAGATDEKPEIIGAEWVYVGNTFAFNKPYGVFMDTRNGSRYQARVGDPLGDTLLSALVPKAATITKGELSRMLPLVDPTTAEISSGGAANDEEAALMMAKWWEEHGNKARDEYANAYIPRPNENLPPANPPSAEDVAKAKEEYDKKYGEQFRNRATGWSPDGGYLNPNDYNPDAFPSREEMLRDYMQDRLPQGIPKEGAEIKPGEYVKDANGTRFIRVNTSRRKKG